MERTFNAPAQAVFDAWTNEEVLRRWWHAEARLGDAARGGRRPRGRDRAGRHAQPHDGQEYGGGGEYTVVDPPTRLAFTWTWDDDEDSNQQLIEIELVERDGTTTVLFTNSGLTSEESRESHRDGWDKAFDNLDVALEAP